MFQRCHAVYAHQPRVSIGAPVAYFLGLTKSSSAVFVSSISVSCSLDDFPRYCSISPFSAVVLMVSVLGCFDFFRLEAFFRFESSMSRLISSVLSSRLSDTRNYPVKQFCACDFEKQRVFYLSNYRYTIW